MPAAADSIISALRRAITAQAKTYPQPAFRSYILRRLDAKIDKAKLFDQTKKEELANDLQTELDQLKRMCNLANSAGSSADYQNVLEHQQDMQPSSKE